MYIIIVEVLKIFHAELVKEIFGMLQGSTDITRHSALGYEYAKGCWDGNTELESHCVIQYVF